MNETAVASRLGFRGRIALVTGAGGGMGLAVSLALLEGGARVTGLDLKAAPAPLLEAGGDYRQGDLSDEDFVRDAVAAAAPGGRLDYLVNAAGVLWFDRDRSALDMDLEVWDRVLAVNLRGMVHTARHAVPCMRRAGAGAMVHVASTQCLRGDDHPQDAYQASKAGVIALSKSLAIQLAGEGIRSNVLVPGPTDTPMQARWRDAPEMAGATAGRVPLGRVGAAADMANAVLFLLSDAAAFVTGTELIVDGGLTARP